MLAAGSGTRLLPLSRLRPKALCPVAGRPLVDHAVDRVRPHTTDVAVNVHHGRDAMVDHLTAHPDSPHVSVEPGTARGTAGALGLLRDWVDGRAVLVVNADTWAPGDLAPLLEGWDGERIRIYANGSDRFGPRIRLAGSLMPWSAVRDLSSDPSGLYEVSWRQAAERDRLETVRHDGPFVDCATPADYLEANLAANEGQSVIGDGAVVEGRLVSSVVWDGGRVHAAERLERAIRADDRTTVLVRDVRGRGAATAGPAR